MLGVKAILAYDPQHRPSILARSPAPRVHATKAARKAFYEIYTAFVATFHEASERLLHGDRNAPFPISAGASLRGWITEAQALFDSLTARLRAILTSRKAR